MNLQKRFPPVYKYDDTLAKNRDNFLSIFYYMLLQNLSTELFKRVIQKNEKI